MARRRSRNLGKRRGAETDARTGPESDGVDFGITLYDLLDATQPDTRAPGKKKTGFDERVFGLFREAHALRVARGAKQDFSGFLQEVIRDASIAKQTGITRDSEISRLMQEAMMNRMSRSARKDPAQDVAQSMQDTMMDPETWSVAGDKAPQTGKEMHDLLRKAYAGRTIAGKEVKFVDDPQEMLQDPEVQRAIRDKTAKSFMISTRVPDIRNRHYLTALRLEERGDVAGALKHMDKALRDLPDNAEILANRSTLLIDLGRTDEAMEGYRKALEVDPDDDQTYSNMGVAMRRAGRPAEAIPYYDKAIECWMKNGESARDLARIYNNKGKALVDMGELDDALKMHEKSIQTDASYALAYRNKAWVLAKMGLSKEAKKCAIRALQIEAGAT